MKPFAFQEPDSVAAAIAMLEAGGGSARLIAGGSDLLGELKDGIAHYDPLVSLGGIAALSEIGRERDVLRIGAGVTLAQLESDPRIADPYPLLAEAARSIATPEIRNQGTLGGNLCQRPRCLHYRSGWVSCAKKGGGDCPALASEHQHYLSVFPCTACYSVHPSDLAPPLIALGALARVRGSGGERAVPLADFFAGPEADVRRENVLSSAEVLTAVEVPRPAEHWRGVYLKARERTAGDFPLVSVAFGCDSSSGKLQGVRMVLGGVAPVPRPCPGAEAVLEGRAPASELAHSAARVAFADAAPLAHNGFKLEIGRALVARAIGQVTGQ